VQDWPIGEGLQLIVGISGDRPMLDDDCPICRALREAGEPVFTLDEFGGLELVGDIGEPWD
jgi:hypothetical protein